MIIEQITVQRISKVIKLSPKWVALFEYTQKHPFVKFEHLEFTGGEPNIASLDLKITESIKF